MIRSNNSNRALIAPALITLVSVSVLAWLCIWQMQRLAWKEAIIARIEARVTAPPVAIPDENSWNGLKPEDYEYRHVTATGNYDTSTTAVIFRASAPLKAGGGDGAGYFILTPLRLADGAHVLINRGFIPRRFRDALPPGAEAPAGMVTVTGLMRSPEARNAFTPADEPANGLWYTRDAASIAARFHIARAAPFVIDEDAIPGSKSWPRGGATEVVITNHHLIYALTWFGLAITLLVIFGIWAHGLRKGVKD